MPIVNFPVGTRVRSFDFPGRTDCFIDGLVMGVGHDRHGDHRYTIRVDRRVVEGVERPIHPSAAIVYPPLNGLEGFFGPTQGVVKLDDQTSPYVAACDALTGSLKVPA